MLFSEIESFGNRKWFWQKNIWGGTMPEKRKIVNSAIESSQFNEITERYYQTEAVLAVCDNLSQGRQRSLLVMASGTGKTRTAIRLTDVLIQRGLVKSILFLTDNAVLVEQAEVQFKRHLPQVALGDFMDEIENKKMKVMISTYSNLFNTTRKVQPDLIIMDEIHRSMIKKHHGFFKGFSSIIVGFTSTPKLYIDQKIYKFFEVEQGNPTYVYDAETAVYKDAVLVPYYNIDTMTNFSDETMVYDDLSIEEQAKYEDDFIDALEPRERRISAHLKQYLFSQAKIDIVLKELMQKGIRVAKEDCLGKTIIFAQNREHAKYIVERFNMLYPAYNGTFAKSVSFCDVDAQTIVNAFKRETKEPRIIVSSDMMDTGIDVSEVVNIVFLKKVYSKTRFWQMVGRGARTCKGLACLDEQSGAYVNKRYFYIFDYVRNFEFFRAHKENIENEGFESLEETIFCNRIRLIQALQTKKFIGTDYQAWRNHLIDVVHKQIQTVEKELSEARLQMRHVEQYKDRTVFSCISEQDKYSLIHLIAPLVSTNDMDEAAKRFDCLMYSMMLSALEGGVDFEKYRNRLIRICTQLLVHCSDSLDVRKKMPLLKDIVAEEFWGKVDILTMECIRADLRDLVNYIVIYDDEKVAFLNPTKRKSKMKSKVFL